MTTIDSMLEAWERRRAAIPAVVYPAETEGAAAEAEAEQARAARGERLRRIASE